MCPDVPSKMNREEIPCEDELCGNEDSESKPAKVKLPGKTITDEILANEVSDPTGVELASVAPVAPSLLHQSLLLPSLLCPLLHSPSLPSPSLPSILLPFSICSFPIFCLFHFCLLPQQSQHYTLQVMESKKPAHHLPPSSSCQGRNSRGSNITLQNIKKWQGTL